MKKVNRNEYVSKMQEHLDAGTALEFLIHGENGIYKVVKKGTVEVVGQISVSGNEHVYYLP